MNVNLSGTKGLVATTTRTIRVGKHSIEVSNLDKVFYPATQTTKGDVIEYYRAISGVLLPHARYRPVTLKRFPDGVEGFSFFEKKCPQHRPNWVKTIPLRRKRDDTDVHYCQINTEAALAWAAQIANLELHVSLATARAVDRPRAVVLDLDPGEGVDVITCGQLALRLRDMLAEHDVKALVKTSGSKGLHFFIPLNTPVSYDDTRPWARELARKLERDTPDEVVSGQSRAERAGKVLIDWAQNSFARTTVCAYSLRAMPAPTVSTPITWTELEAAVEADEAESLRFTVEDVLERVEEHGDLFAPVLEIKQRLPQL
jgi:bifunctional non-homologous end joining protein LigD